jgi:hypothetical protein
MTKSNQIKLFAASKFLSFGVVEADTTPPDFARISLIFSLGRKLNAGAHE